MKFCRQCGTVLGASTPGIPPQPVMGGGPPQGFGPGPGPMGPPPGMGGMGGAPPFPSAGGGPPPGMGMGGPMGPPPGMGGMGGGPMGPPPGMGAMPGMGGAPPFPGAGGGPPPGMGGPPPGFGGPPPGMGAAPGAGNTTCPRCGSSTPSGFAFCQQCGMKLGGPAPGGAPAGGGGPGIDAYGGTIAAGGPDAANIRAAAMGSAPTPAAQPTWGQAISVNRDGSDGERFPLGSEYVVFGRAGADVAFDQDRFLARQHARLERTGDGARVVPLDQVNGVFKKLDAAVELTDGAIILLGREVLRYETVDGDERAGEPLVRHGVALFGSPPREPWGRLLQLLPSGGVRDVRHLFDDEVVLGREEGDIVFSDDAFMSRKHAAIAWDGKRVTVGDLGSSNGSFIRLTGVTPVKHGDHLRMGDQLFRIELRR